MGKWRSCWFVESLMARLVSRNRNNSLYILLFAVFLRRLRRLQCGMSGRSNSAVDQGYNKLRAGHTRNLYWEGDDEGLARVLERPEHGRGTYTNATKR